MTRVNDEQVEGAQNAAVACVAALTTAGVRAGITDETIALMAVDAALAYLRGVEVPDAIRERVAALKFDLDELSDAADGSWNAALDAALDVLGAES